MKTSRKAPIVKSPSKKHPNFMRENSPKSKGKSSMAPLMKKRLSK